MSAALKFNKSMLLSDLLKDVYQLPPGLERNFNGLELDSRRIEKGNLFLAYKGASNDGRSFIAAAINKGASAVLTEADENWSEPHELTSVPIIPIKYLPAMLGRLAARFYGYPAQSMRVIGVTGTNGKTSCCQLAAQALTMLGYKCGVIGTLGFGTMNSTLIQDESGPATTPDPVRMQEIFAELQIQECDSVVMEVTSHGLDQQRVNVDDFAVAVFTNLTRDHLDYHGTMQAYGEAKLKLFTGENLEVAVVNIDDSFSATLLDALDTGVQRYTWSVHNHEADIYASKLGFTPEGLVIKVASPWGNGTIHSPLLGSFNASNLLAVLSTLLASEAEKPDFNAQRIMNTVSKLKPIRGRMEVISGYPITVVIDYAHTPDGLQNALSALREHFASNICCVFGCGGNRDKGKRPLMGEIAARMADQIVLTDDNPRHEDSAEIIQQILAGIARQETVIVESDRAEAIAYAITTAQEGDVVLIAGKGHETYQDAKGQHVSFSDIEQAQHCLSQRFAGMAGSV
ncbi:MAG: UDP-N-acetylmuramoyl-L-alanyl-D-glutamate--2,6-diaminopimelate ligase [Pseudomonadota bacterium]